MSRRMGGPMIAKAHLKEYFENLSQVLFFRNAYFGAAFLILSLLFNFDLFICGAVGSAIGFIYSLRYRTPKFLKQTGLITINGFFFGIAFASLFHTTNSFYFCLLLGSLAIPLVTKAAFEVLQHWKLSPLIFPYIISIWVLWLCSPGVSLEPIAKDLPSSLSVLSTLFPQTHASVQILESMFYSIGQIFFFQSADYGLCLLLLVAAFHRRRGLYFLCGTLLATVVFYGITNNSIGWEYGAFSYSAGLVGLGLASLPEKFSFKTIMLFCVLSLFVTLALDHFMARLNLPLLSLPYVITFWFAILSRAPRLNVNWSSAEVV